MIERIFKLALSAVLVITCGLPMSKVESYVQAVEEEVYELYPKPHEFVYEEGSFIIRQDVNIIYDEKVDAATRSRLNEILKLKEKNVSESNQGQRYKTNIYVGIYGSNDVADAYIQSHYPIDHELFKKKDANLVVSNHDEIYVLGKDHDAVFYGVTSLMHILKQMEGSTIRHFKISDYSDTKIRGFIEGYYGTPWSHENRKSLMEFGGQFKMNAYIYAPKNDPYHAGNKWRELYSDSKMNEIAELAKIGEETKCQFVYALHPFKAGDFMKDHTLEEEIGFIKARFEQLYEVGVRQFGILADDIGSVDRNVVIKMMDEISKWAEAKGDVYDIVYCPTGYNHNSQKKGSYQELNEFDEAFADNIQIFWTGEWVESAINQSTLDHFRSFDYEGEKGKRRAPLFWLNWPVNDSTNKSFLRMGQAEYLKNNIHPEDLTGVVTNPMQEAQASKVALFAVADYAWNVNGFDMAKSWHDGFSYIEPNAPEALEVLAKHMTGRGDESKELDSLVKNVQQKLEMNQPLGEQGTQLIEEMKLIMTACNEFSLYSTNALLQEEMKPFISSLYDLANAILHFTEARQSLDVKDVENALSIYSKGSALLHESKQYGRKTFGTTYQVKPGNARLIPLADSMNEMIGKAINESILEGGNEENNELIITASSSFETFNQGKIEDIIDGDLNTFAWHNGYEAVGQYYQLNFNQPTTIYGIHVKNGAIVQGKPDKLKDTFGYAVLKYTTDGKTWKNVSDDVYGEYAEEVDIKVKLEGIVGLRYECSKTSSGRKWPSMREFYVDLTQNPEISASSSFTSWYQDNTLEKMIDGNPNTAAWYNHGEAVGQYFQLNFSSPADIREIHILNGNSKKPNDTFGYAVLKYTTDGINWIPVNDKEYGEYVTEVHEIVDLTNIVGLRYECSKKSSGNKWPAMREFSVVFKENVDVADGEKVYTNVSAYENYPAKYANEEKDELNLIVPVQNITLKKNEYIGLKLDRIHELNEISSTLSTIDGLTIEVSENPYEWKEVVSGKVSENARYIRIMNHTENDITFDIEKFEVTTREVHDKSFLNKFGYGSSNVSDPLNIFDGNWETKLHDGRSQYAGVGFTYDLGQTIHFNSLKVVIHDSTIAYPRHAKISLSMDNKNWTDVLFLGEQDQNNPGEVEGEDIAVVFPENDANFRYKQVSDLDIDARYMKFEITRNEQFKNWIGMDLYEIEINDGEFIPTSNDPTYKSDANETFNGLFEYMTDQDLSTMYIPDKNTGYIRYSLSDKNDQNLIRIIQNSNTISNANVMARVYLGNGQSEWLNLGTLSQTVNEFVLPNDKILLEVKIQWKDTILNITECSFSQVENGRIDKSKLNDLLQNLQDTTSWTDSSKEAYDQAISVGKLIAKSEYTSQTMVDHAFRNIQNAIENKQTMGDVTPLQELVEHAEKDCSLYTASSWKDYEKSIIAAWKALEDKDSLSQEMIDQYVADIQNSKENLKYNPSVSEQAELLFEDMSFFIQEIENASIYTTNSYQALIKANDELASLLITNAENALHPNVFREPMAKVKTAKAELVLVYTLPDLIKEYETVNESLYTKESFNAYKKVVEDSKELLVSGTTETIAMAIQEIEATKGQLKLIYTPDNLKELLMMAKDKQQDNYTKDSYQNLSKSIKKAQEVVNRIHEATNEEIKDVSELLQRSMNELVSIESLKDAIATAENFNEDHYTKKSYNALKEVIQNGKKRMIDGTEEQIIESIQSIDEAVKGLIVRVNEKEANDYISSIKDIDFSNYTKDSGEVVQETLNVLKKMQKDFSDISADEFKQAQIDFENAKRQLKLLDADYHAVDQAIEKANKLVKSEYQDFSAVDNAIQRVVRGKKITEQEEVDAMAKAITDAISKLEKKKDTSTSDGSVDTSDSSQRMMWMTLTVLASLGFVAFLFKRIKIERN